MMLEKFLKEVEPKDEKKRREKQQSKMDKKYLGNKKSQLVFILAYQGDKIAITKVLQEKWMPQFPQ